MSVHLPHVEAKIDRIEEQIIERSGSVCGTPEHDMKGLPSMRIKGNISSTCEVCNTPYVTHWGNYGRFCSRQCFAEWKRSQRPSRTCAACGTQFHPRPAQLENGQGRYCSVACVGKGRTRPIQERFWERVDKSGDCWEWTGPLASTGYGRLYVNGHSANTHRLSWQLHNGDIPDGLVVCHQCDNRACVNPSHLFLGTSQDNMDDMFSKGRNSPPPRFLGEKHVNAKLTADSVREIRRLYATGSVTLDQLAAQFGVAFTTIGKVIRRETWRHVE